MGPNLGRFSSGETPAPGGRGTSARFGGCRGSGSWKGPDGLGNDWYRDFHDQLTGILTTLCQAWLRYGVFPASFTTAHILGLAKSGAINPLDFRPIALLNTDYMVFARTQAARLRKHSWRLVHALQSEFIPRRDIHAILDAFYAAKA